MIFFVYASFNFDKSFYREYMNFNGEMIVASLIISSYNNLNHVTSSTRADNCSNGELDKSP